tara:strand:+ start:3680 stop:3877 length:198 start_codon:yes stop_codon:yes gene_type:complete
MALLMHGHHSIMAILKLLVHRLEAVESKLQMILDACERIEAEDEYSVYSETNTESEDLSQQSAPP